MGSTACKCDGLCDGDARTVFRDDDSVPPVVLNSADVLLSERAPTADLSGYGDPRAAEAPPGQALPWRPGPLPEVPEGPSDVSPPLEGIIETGGVDSCPSRGSFHDAVPIDLVARDRDTRRLPTTPRAGTAGLAERVARTVTAEAAGWRGSAMSSSSMGSPRTLTGSEVVQQRCMTIEASGNQWYSEAPKSTHVSVRRERLKSFAALLVVFGALSASVAYLVLRGLSSSDAACPSDEELEQAGIDPAQCCKPCGGAGMWLLPLGREWERGWPAGWQTAFYLALMLWCFLGVQIVCDEFMAAIEEITSKTKTVKWVAPDGVQRTIPVRVWNATVANLTLMALGSSAPEILISVIELVTGDWSAGRLGPSTVVGSAAFNLFVITGVCISAIPAGQQRRIEQIEVFGVTSVVSVLAYLWIWVVLEGTSPQQVDLLEGMLTLAMLGVLVVAAFLVDKGWLWHACARARPAVAEVFGPAGVEDPVRDVGHAASWPGTAKSGSPLASSRSARSSASLRSSPERRAGRSRIRQEITARATGGKKASVIVDGCSIGFASANHTVSDMADGLRIRVGASGLLRGPLQIRYRTLEGSSKARDSYEHTEGILRLDRHDGQHAFEVPLIPKTKCPRSTSQVAWSSSKTPDFFIELSDLAAPAMLAPSSEASPSVRDERTREERMAAYGRNVSMSFNSLRSNSSMPSSRSQGTPRSNQAAVSLGIAKTGIWLVDDGGDSGDLAFEVPEVYVAAGVEKATVNVVRLHSACGRVTASYRTLDGSAACAQDYTAAEGVLEFAEGQLCQSVVVAVGGTRREESVRFSVRLFAGADGAGEPDRAPLATCEVILLSEGRRDGDTPEAEAGLLGQWLQRVPEAVYCNGSPEHQAEASVLDWLSHVLALFWKATFVVVPPASAGGGWPAFASALFAIGCLTFVVKELAQLLGCAVGFQDEITAVTLVALGTSLPDTFTSWTAAEQHETADDAIGNVTGSNCVNVFMGLGLTWTMGAIYWQLEGASDKWKAQRHGGQTFESLWGSTFPKGGFMYPSGSLSFSVTVFSGLAVVCFALLAFRRRTYGGELGGSRLAQRRDSLFLFTLWIFFLVAYIWKIEASR